MSQDSIKRINKIGRRKRKSASNRSLRNRGKSTLGISKSKSKANASCPTFRKKPNPTNLSETTISTVDNNSFLAPHDQKLGNKVLELLQFVLDKTEHTPFEGHDMIQRQLCSFYQISYPSRFDNEYDIGTVDGEKDPANSGRVIHNLVKKLIRNKENGEQFFKNLIKVGLETVKNNPNYFTLPQKLPQKLQQIFLTNWENIEASHIAEKFLEIADKYAESVEKVKVVIEPKKPSPRRNSFFKDTESNKDNSIIKEENNDFETTSCTVGDACIIL